MLFFFSALDITHSHRIRQLTSRGLNSIPVDYQISHSLSTPSQPISAPSERLQQQSLTQPKRLTFPSLPQSPAKRQDRGRPPKIEPSTQPPASSEQTQQQGLVHSSRLRSPLLLEPPVERGKRGRPTKVERSTQPSASSEQIQQQNSAHPYRLRSSLLPEPSGERRQRGRQLKSEFYTPSPPSPMLRPGPPPFIIHRPISRLNSGIKIPNSQVPIFRIPNPSGQPSLQPPVPVSLPKSPLQLSIESETIHSPQKEDIQQLYHAWRSEHEIGAPPTPETMMHIPQPSLPQEPTNHVAESLTWGDHGLRSVRTRRRRNS